MRSQEIHGKGHCATCTCGKRAPVQGDLGFPRAERTRGPGSITWEEYLSAFSIYLARHGGHQTPDSFAKRGGFSYKELVDLFGHDPKTWRPLQG